jgi:hypothetical protein
MGKVLKTTEDWRALKQRYADLEWSWNSKVFQDPAPTSPDAA